MSVQLRNDLTLAETEYGVIALDQESGQYFQFTETAAVIVQQLSAGRTPEQAASVLTERFEVDATVALQDVQTFVASLRRTGLVS